MQIYTTEQLVERLKSHKKAASGDLYGLVSQKDGKLQAVVMALVGKEGDLGHSPSLLLPPPMTKLGVFEVTEEEEEERQFNIEDDEIHIVWNQKELVYYSGNSKESQALPTITGTQLNTHFALAKITFTLHLWLKECVRDASSAASLPGITNTKGNAGMVCEELNMVGTCYRVKGGCLVIGGNGVVCGGDAAAASGSASLLFKSSTTSKKKPAGSSNIQEITLELLFNRSGTDIGTVAPVVRVDNRLRAITCAVVAGEAVAYLDKASSLKEMCHVLTSSVSQQVRLAEWWLSKQQEQSEICGPLVAFAVLPHTAGHVMSLVYPEMAEDGILKSYREAVHRAFLFPLDRPFVRRGNSLTPPHAIRPSALTNPHTALTPPSTGVPSLLQGGYAYYHYQQGKVDDKGWGCAYRSIQTIVSWFQIQGYTTRPVPSHRDIQKCLVDIGDKTSDFIGSKKWIGSTEVGFVLETMFGVRSRFICVSSGSELASRGGELAMHFSTQGTPVMIGGGVLAHTIIGVEWNEELNTTSFLILDPHYTGPDDVSTAIAKGGVTWKGPDFWNPNAFYNLCLPQRPICI